MHRRQPLPRLWMMTDERQGEGLFDAVSRLPPGAGIVFRHYSLDSDERRRLFNEVRKSADERQLLLILAGHSSLAEEWGADGSHGLRYGYGSSANLLRSASVHGLDELREAETVGVDFVFASPVFPTRSHPGAGTHGIQGLAEIVHEASIPVLALGGMNAERARALEGIGVYGWAAIDAWSA